MVDVDFDKIADRCEELTEYSNVLPLFVRCVIYHKWTKYLDDNGLYDDIIPKCISSMPHTYDEAVKELSDWCNENKDYKEFIKK